MNDTTPPTGLVVPVDVAAFCIGQDDVETANNFAGATTAYDNQTTSSTPAFIGSNVTRGFDVAPWDPMGQGVHLHWALPDALTRASTTSGNLNFPATPNRWLVTRIVANGNQPGSRSWLVESDTLLTSRTSGDKPVTLPVKDANQNYRYLGTSTGFDANWREPQLAANQTLVALSNSELNAVTSGDISFAAFYPNARNVFGFYDTLDDLQVSGQQPVNLTYVVSGWFSNAQNDPLNGGVALPTIQANYGWTYDSADTQAPSYTIYNGIVQDVAWNPTTQYVLAQGQQQPLQADLAIGNTPPEALSAYFRALDYPNNAFFETLFTAFQAGLLTTLQQPSPDQLAGLYESLHAARFGGSNAGTIYTVMQVDDAGNETEVLTLPLVLADSLNLLNSYQQQYDLCQAEEEQYVWQLFADWYRIFRGDPSLQQAAYRATAERYSNFAKLDQTCQQLKTQLDAQCAVVQGQLAEHNVLKAVPATPYASP
ncbi:MAG: hypothetical protein M3328_02840, partial [Chloroflexota bacterium]|nr:hypothetical protein [Chloroflexota bacterium]